MTQSVQHIPERADQQFEYGKHGKCDDGREHPLPPSQEAEQRQETKHIRKI